jgi:hypothetical protein
MKLRSLRLDDMIVIPFGKSAGEGLPRVDLYEQSFHESEGWDISETLPGIFVLTRDDMDDSVTIGGFGYVYTRAKEALAPEPATPTRKARR